MQEVAKIRVKVLDGGSRGFCWGSCRVLSTVTVLLRQDRHDDSLVQPQHLQR